MKNKSIITSLVFAIALINSCKNDDPAPENPEELITTLNVVFTPQGGGAVITLQFRDLDGDGGNPPVITGDTLAAQTEYHTILSFLDESTIPVADITEEILDEDEDHQFFFQLSGVQMTHTYDDMDSNGNPIGIVNSFFTGDAANGTFKVILRHKPDKSAAGVANGDITNAGGETDIEVLFPVVIQ
ncbi:MAG TPA: hypothetical protein VI603_09270 [Saprospiraceae bacterium]|nr:hypothetical protein [Saprospiraceae bacterium]